MKPTCAMNAPEVDDQQHERAKTRKGGNEQRNRPYDLDQAGEVSEPLSDWKQAELLHHHFLAAQLGEAGEEEQRGHQDAQRPKNVSHREGRGRCRGSHQRKIPSKRPHHRRFRMVGQSTKSHGPPLARPGEMRSSWLVSHIFRLERVKGIEPSYSAWKAAALPLSYTRLAEAAA
jgi:hypothetical protein